MKPSTDTRLIGAFVLAALALTVAVILVFGRTNLFSPAKRYVAYFQGSVNGLNVGAPVRLKGVAIGRVTDILVQYDTENDRVLTPVIAEIDLGKVMDIHEDDGKTRHRPGLQELIDRGLRARLSVQSLVTGHLFVDVNFYPDKPVHRVGAERMGLPEIPTIASSKDEIETTIGETVSELRKLPIKETFDATRHSVEEIEHLLTQPETKASIANLNRTLEDLDRLVRHADARVEKLAAGLDGTVTETRTLLRHLNARLEPLLGATEKTLGSVSATFAQAQGTLAGLEAFSGPDSELATALRDVSAAARSARLLADYLERHPEALVYGKRESGRE
jgi:paraquat-inducible protein B